MLIGALPLPDNVLKLMICYMLIVFCCSCKDSAERHTVSVTVRVEHVISGVLGLSPQSAAKLSNCGRALSRRGGGVVGINRKQIARASSTCREELDDKGFCGPDSAGNLA